MNISISKEEALNVAAGISALAALAFQSVEENTPSAADIEQIVFLFRFQQTLINEAIVAKPEKTKAHA